MRPMPLLEIDAHDRDPSDANHSNPPLLVEPHGSRRGHYPSQDNLTHDTKKYMSSLDGWHETRLALLAIEPDFTNTSIND